MSLSSVVALLRGRWPALLTVAGLTLGPAVAATALIDVLGPRAQAVVNGTVVTAGDPWASLVVSGIAGGDAGRVVVPPLMALAGFVALSVGLRVLSGEPFGQAWRPSGVPSGSWLALGTMLALLVVAAISVVLVAANGINPLVGLAAALVFAFELARLVLVLPATLIDRQDVVGALARATSVSRRRYLSTGALLIALWVGSPVVLLGIANRLSDPPPRLGDSWVGDVLGAEVASLSRRWTSPPPWLPATWWPLATGPATGCASCSTTTRVWRWSRSAADATQFGAALRPPPQEALAVRTSRRPYDQHRVRWPYGHRDR